MEKSATQYEDEINSLRAQYNELAELAGSLAHEIKTPLSVISLNVALMAEDFEGANTPEERRTLLKLKELNKQCDRLNELVRDFLRYSRPEKIDLHIGDLNLELESVIDFFAVMAEESGIEVIRHLDSDLPSVMLDRQMIQVALQNLIKNAVESMEEGGQFLVRTRATLNGVALDLIDNGCGMDDNTLVKVFTPFYTRKEGGSGLGLPTAKRFIEAHGGTIGVQSEIGLGTQFTIELPVPKRIDS
ncbi:MAG: ATP-binding protein [Planctomycetota bacterium]|nr:ATP-binding protein [Planctomycetota bacterium]